MLGELHRIAANEDAEVCRLQTELSSCRACIDTKRYEQEAAVGQWRKAQTLLEVTATQNERTRAALAVTHSYIRRELMGSITDNLDRVHIVPLRDIVARYHAEHDTPPPVPPAPVTVPQQSKGLSQAARLSFPRPAKTVLRL